MSKIKKLVSLVAALWVSPVFAAPGDKLIDNTNLNKDLVFQLNIGGSAKPVLKLLGTTGSTQIGVPGSTASHTINVGAASRAIKFGPGDGNVRPGLVVDNAGSSIAAAFATGAGNPQINYAGGTLLFNNGAYANVSNTSDMGTSGLGGTTVGSVTTAGAWTLGPSNSSAKNLFVNGIVQVNGGSGNIPAIQFGPWSGNQWGMIGFKANFTNNNQTVTYATTGEAAAVITSNFNSATSGLLFQVAPAGTAGNPISFISGLDITTAGAVTIGPGLPTTNEHTFHGRVRYQETNDTYEAVARAGSSQNIAVSGTADITLQSQMHGFINIACNAFNNGNIQSVRMFKVASTGSGGLHTPAEIGTAFNGTGGACAYTLTNPSLGVVRITNSNACTGSIAISCHWFVTAQQTD